jgi:pimeloyl-ACP methyl ester carboxylesterase
VTATLKDALATLATVPPTAFARQRDALAVRLREAGDSTAVAQVKARRVPTLPVWVVNRLALDHPDDVEALIAAAERVKAAQLGRGQGGTLATATAAHRAALDRLRERAGVMLRDAGGATADKLLRVQNTLTAAAVDAQARAALRAGHLERELTAPGFDVFGGARPLATRSSRPRAPAARAGTTGTPARTAAAASPAAAKVEERRREREATRAARQERIAQARTAVTEAEQQAAAARQARIEAEGRLEEMLEQVQQARRALRERTTAAHQQDITVTRARRELRAAERKARARAP